MSPNRKDFTHSTPTPRADLGVGPGAGRCDIQVLPLSFTIQEQVPITTIPRQPGSWTPTTFIQYGAGEGQTATTAAVDRWEQYLQGHWSAELMQGRAGRAVVLAFSSGLMSATYNSPSSVAADELRGEIP